MFRQYVRNEITPKKTSERHSVRLQPYKKFLNFNISTFYDIRTFHNFCDETKENGTLSTPAQRLGIAYKTNAESATNTLLFVTLLFSSLYS
jgi:hypothetical protein